MRLFALISLAVLAGGCAGNGPYINVGEKTARLKVPSSAGIRLDAVIGEIVVRGVGDNYLDARVELSCREKDKGCRRRAEKIKIVSRADTSSIGIALEPNSMVAWRDVQAKIDISVPRDRALFLKIGAGELEVLGMRNCVELDMYAGEASIRIDRTVVGSVSLDVGTGDTSLVVDGNTVEGKRALLVGAELEWGSGGDGWCRVLGDLQFGELTVYLE